MVWRLIELWGLDDSLRERTGFKGRTHCFLYNLSSSGLSNCGYERIFNGLPLFVLPIAPTDALGADSERSVVATGAIAAMKAMRVSE